MAASIYLTLIGSFGLSVGHRHSMMLPPKERTLLAFLALRQGRPAKRQVVSELLWPDLCQQQARNSLNQELSVLLRNAIGGMDVIAFEDGALAVPPAHIACDVHQRRALIQASTDVSRQAEMQPYCGPLLHGFGPISPESDDPISAIAKAAESDVITTLEVTTNKRGGNGDFEQCMMTAEGTHSIDPLREVTHRGLIDDYATARPAHTIRAYTEVKALLRRKLNVAPAAETEALIARARPAPTTTFPPHPVTTARRASLCCRFGSPKTSSSPA
jgi:DNA-binding SARP family transcriptional activator